MKKLTNQSLTEEHSSGASKELISLRNENKDLKIQLADSKTHLLTSMATITHELKNILTLVLGNIQLIERDYPDITDIPYWKSLRSDTAHMQEFLTDLSSFRALHEVKLNYQLCDMNEFLTEVCQNCRPLFDGIHKKLILTCPKQPLLLYGDRPKLYQVFANLIKNAMEALGPDGTVSVCLKDPDEPLSVFSDNLVSVEVKDTGCGLTPGHEELIFKPFYTEKADGTGLGLPIVQNILKAHGGQLQVESEPGKGSTFTALIPRYPRVEK